MVPALRRALNTYADKRRWIPLQKRCMVQDFSWEKSAVQYLDVYHALVGQA
jgi:starch synthase